MWRKAEGGGIGGERSIIRSKPCAMGEPLTRRGRAGGNSQGDSKGEGGRRKVKWEWKRWNGLLGEGVADGGK